MSTLDIYQFRDMFANARSVAFVGNASSVLTWDNGKLIDSYDLVVRFNRAYTQGHEEKIGSRTDILVANQANSLEKSPAPAKVLQPQCILTYIKPKRDKDLAPLKAWAGDIPLVITLGPDIPSSCSGNRHRTLTMGTYTLYTFLRLFHLEKILLTGFTMFGMAPGGGEKYYEKELNLGVGASHELDQESLIFSELARQFRGELFMTPEVEALVYNGTGKPRAGQVASSQKKRFIHYLSAKVLTLGFLLRRYAEQDSWLEHDSRDRPPGDRR